MLTFCASGANVNKWQRTFDLLIRGLSDPLIRGLFKLLLTFHTNLNVGARQAAVPHPRGVVAIGGRHPGDEARNLGEGGIETDGVPVVGDCIGGVACLVGMAAPYAGTRLQGHPSHGFHPVRGVLNIVFLQSQREAHRAGFGGSAGRVRATNATGVRVFSIGKNNRSHASGPPRWAQSYPPGRPQGDAPLRSAKAAQSGTSLIGK